MSTTENGVIGLDSVSDDLAIAVRTDGGEQMDGTFEGIEDEMFSAQADFERLVVFISASGAFTHNRYLSFPGWFIVRLNYLSQFRAIGAGAGSRAASTQKMDVDGFSVVLH